MKRITLALILVFIFFSSLFAVDFEVNREYEQDLIQKVMSIYNNKTTTYPLPKCGTSVMSELALVQDKLSPEALGLLEPYLARPNLQRSYNTPGGHFKIHYSISGSNGVYHPTEDNNPPNGIPDYVDRCAEACDYVWAKEIDTMDYRQPPSDGSAGGDSRYDIYIRSLGWGYLGATTPEFQATPSWSYTSYIELTNDFSPYGYPNQYDLMDVTVAHEFFHAVQFGYDRFEGYDPYPNWRPYWMEMSSTWMEDQAFDNVNDYVGYLPYFFDYPWTSLKTFSTNFPSPRAYHPYASCIFPIYLSEKFGVGVMKDIWEECGRIPYGNTFPAIDTALRPFGADFDSAFKEFLVWNLFTEMRADTFNYYSEGDLFPEIKILDQQKHGAYPVNIASVDSMPENLASNYVRFTPLAGPGGLTMYFDGTETAKWVVPIIGYKASGEHLIDAFQLDVQQEGNFGFYNWYDYSYIYMIAGVLTMDSSKYDYGYADTFNINLGVAEDELSGMGEFVLPQNYPNPFNSQTALIYTLGRDGVVSIGIYNILGQKVKDLFNGQQKSGRKEIIWNGKDNEDKELPSGIYFYRIDTEDFNKTKKMVLLK